MEKIEKILELLFTLEKEVETATPEELEKIHQQIGFGSIEIEEREAPNKTKKVYNVREYNPYTGEQEPTLYGSKRGVFKKIIS